MSQGQGFEFGSLGGFALGFPQPADNQSTAFVKQHAGLYLNADTVNTAQDVA